MAGGIGVGGPGVRDLWHQVGREGGDGWSDGLDCRLGEGTSSSAGGEWGARGGLPDRNFRQRLLQWGTHTHTHTHTVACPVEEHLC